MNPTVDRGASLISPTHMVLLALVLNSENNFIIANNLGVVWCSNNEQTNPLCVYRCFLTNRLHGKAAELCLANSVTTTEYIQ